MKTTFINNRPHKIRFTVSCLLLLFTMLTGCDKKTEIKIADAAGNFTESLAIEKQTSKKVFLRLADGQSVAVTKKPKRTVILLTSLLNLWYEANGNAIARCNGKLNVPENALILPEVGTFNHPNVEKIIALEPDLVIASDLAAFRAMIPILEQNHIEYAYFNYVNF